MTSTPITSYHECSFKHDKRERAVNQIVDCLKHVSPEVGLAFTGLSGILVGVLVADRTKRPFAILRKKGDSKNACRQIEGYSFNKYLIIDDFIATGGTVKKIIHAFGAAECIGILLYDETKKETSLKIDNDKYIPIQTFKVD